MTGGAPGTCSGGFGCLPLLGGDGTGVGGLVVVVGVGSGDVTAASA